jgi:hypothetical protein
MKTLAIAILVVLLVSYLLLVSQPRVNAQSTSNIVSYSLSFHNYSILMSEPNGSFLVYDGADGAAPTSANPTQANLISEIPGTQSGFSYWSAVVIWVIKLPYDLHVDGSVGVSAYISSNFKLSGLFSGGGYGMGLVDIDQNNNEVQQFITQGPESLGNPFHTTPTLYSLNTNIDYTFKQGHSIGFAVGLGATSQGFTATVYFGSSNYASGAILPFQDVAQSNSFSTGQGSVTILSDSAISNYQFASASNSMQFTAQGINYTTAFCNVSIPKSLLQKPFAVTSASQQITATLTENSTYYQLYFTHLRTSNPIIITGSAVQPTATPTVSPTASPQPTSGATGTPNPSATATSTTATPNSSPTATSPGTSPTTPASTTEPPTGSTTPFPTSTTSGTPTVPEYQLIVTLAIVALVATTAISTILLRKKHLNKARALNSRVK